MYLGSLQVLPSFINEQFRSDATNLSSVLSNALNFFRIVRIVVDASDECHERLRLVQNLQLLTQSGLETAIHILLTCRIGTSNVEHKLGDVELLEIRSSEVDVRSYIHQRSRSSDSISEFNDDDPQFFEITVDAILPRLDGMFLLARLYGDSLVDLPIQRDVRDALRILPEGRDETYIQAWDRVNTQTARKRELGTQILLWVVNAERPLRLIEMQHALAIREGDDELDATGFISLATLTLYCAGLVVVDEQRKSLSLGHAKAQEFFNARKKDRFSKAYEVMASICLTHLNLQNFRNEGALSDLRLFTDRWQR